MTILEPERDHSKNCVKHPQAAQGCSTTLVTRNPSSTQVVAPPSAAAPDEYLLVHRQKSAYPEADIMIQLSTD